MDISQEERLVFLIKEFQKDVDICKNIPLPADTEGKRRLLRSLMNLRLPMETPDSVLRIQDDYLSERLRERGTVELSDIPEIKDGLSVWQGDITTLAAEAIVNAANSQMLGCFVPMHGCIDNCIHSFAGVQLLAECHRQMNLLKKSFGAAYEQPTAKPMLTGAYNLPAKKVIHIVGPIIRGGLTSEAERELADCYSNTLKLCSDNGIKEAAFCCISTGVFRFPNARAAEIAVRTVTEWMYEHKGIVKRVVFNVFKDEDKDVYERLLQRIA